MCATAMAADNDATAETIGHSILIVVSAPIDAVAAPAVATAALLLLLHCCCFDADCKVQIQ